MMIEFNQALNVILKNTKLLSVEKVSIEEAAGRILAQDVYSKIEMPPFNKSAMDGYALRAADIKRIPAILRCVGLIEAGQVFRKKIKTGECVKIMTGAALPAGVDSVVMVENTLSKGSSIEIKERVRKLDNVCIKGEDIEKRQKVLNKGKLLSVSDIAVTAACGAAFVKVIKRPRVAVLNTGGEIIPAGRSLGRGKIYNSNGPQLSALLRKDGITACSLGIVKDDALLLTKALKKGLQADALLISGGVSMGDYDLVPAVLEKLGVKKLFHKVKIKPGKPLFFGTKKNTLVFGIPGNPVSNFLTYLIFIQPALYKMMGNENYKLHFRQAIIETDFRHKPGRKHFVPVKVSQRNDRYYVMPVETHGSADILSLSCADGFMVVEADVAGIRKKSKVDFMTWKS